MDYRQKARLNQDKSMRIKHMAFAVKSVDEALLNFQSFLSVSPKTEKVIWEKAETKVAIFFINDIEFQLCESLNKQGRFTEWIEKYGEGLHHICYEVDDIESASQTLQAAGARVLGDGTAKIGAHGNPVLFLHPKDFNGTMIELEQVAATSERPQAE